MSDVAVKPAQRQEQQLMLPLHFSFSGKINGSSQFHENFWYTNVICAAADPYSHPAEFRVRSMRKLATDNGLISGTMKVSCMVRTFDLKNPLPGQDKKGYQNNAFFDLVE